MLVNGEICKLISIRDRGLLYGDGVFRTMRACNGKLLHWPLHYLKLKHDCEALAINCPEEALLLAELAQVLPHHGVIKLIVTRGAGSRGYTPDPHALPTRIWDCLPMPDYPEQWPVLGIKACVCRQRLAAQPAIAGVKHLNRLENVLAAAELEGQQAAEGLMLDAEGHLIEGTRSNLFLVQQGMLITPGLSRCGVAGIQRGRVMAFALQHGITLHVADIKLEQVLQADELFVVNSIIGLWPVRELEQRHWTHFPLADKIRSYLELQDI
jgi:4-amino-4-deoxychorismate lyase